LQPDAYKHFWQWSNAWADSLRQWLNRDIFGPGMNMPYWSLEVLTQTFFKNGAVLVLVDLFYN
jgi:hypothetical protein